jgi:hypothetical protein
MILRLIKPGMSTPRERPKQGPVEVPIIDTIQSWVREFRSTKAARSHSDFERVNNPAKT